LLVPVTQVDDPPPPDSSSPIVGPLSPQPSLSGSSAGVGGPSASKRPKARCRGLKRGQELRLGRQLTAGHVQDKRQKRCKRGRHRGRGTSQ
jgi:hypothetical protein